LYVCIWYQFAFIKKDGGFFVDTEEMEEMERYLEKSIKGLPKSEKAKKCCKQNLKRKLEDARIDGKEEEEEEDVEKENEEGTDDKESILPVDCSSASLRKPNSKRKGIAYRAPFF